MANDEQGAMTAGPVIAVPRLSGELTSIGPDRLLGRRDAIKSVVSTVMKEGIHYGQIPGTRGLTLYKEGSEVLLATFQIAVEPHVTDLSSASEVKFQVELRGIHQVSGAYLGSGLGACSSNEDKYRWRDARSRAEFDSVPPEFQNSPEKWRRTKQTAQGTRSQVRCSPWDHYQTILSMAKKRAMKDLACTVLAASDVLRELSAASSPSNRGYPPRTQQAPPPANRQAPQGNRQAAPAQPAPPAQARPVQPPPQPQAPPAPELIAPEQVNELLELIDQAGIFETEVLARFEVGRIEEIEAAKFAECRDFLLRVLP